jgi:tetratricopeptide (TPR) repeat protein
VGGLTKTTSKVRSAKSNKAKTRRPAKPLPKKGLPSKVTSKKVSLAEPRKPKVTVGREAAREATLQEAAKPAPSPETVAAVRAFEQALKLFNRHDFAAAKVAFENLLKRFRSQTEILARARTYMAICDQRLARAPAAPRGPDALYNQGVFELNKGNAKEAVILFQKALRAQPRASHVLYSLAAAYARLGDAPKAIDALRRAIVIQPVHRSHARRDPDFASLRSNEVFQELAGLTPDLAELE